MLGRKRAIVQHMRALPHGEVVDARATVRTSRALVTTKDAFEFLVLTALPKYTNNKFRYNTV